MVSPFVTSAPGKVILFGEHAVVYNKPAIALLLSLRTYLLVSENLDKDKICLEFPDIDFSFTWNIADFPWDLVLKNGLTSSRPSTTEELIPEIVDHLSNHMLNSLPSLLHYSALLCFLYMYVNLCDKSTPGCTFCVRSTLPIGAGLGSSLSISVCISSALSYLGGHVEAPSLRLDDPITSTSENPDCQFIDSWAFMGEKCIHGTPSGIDNACASHGGAVMFQRSPQTAASNVRTSMRNFPSLDLLLTNTKIPRRTLDLVANVSRLNQEYPPVIAAVLTAMEQILKELYSIMLRPLNEESKNKLLELVKVNQGLLSSLGVSHPALDKIKMLTDELGVGETKLTGAGGGGCAITLLNNKNTALLEELVQRFELEGFETFQTTLGGKGCGLLVAPSGTDLFSPEKFISFKSRTEIENSVGCQTLPEWRFW